jgi:exopolysaccharide biosynthesis protein
MHGLDSIQLGRVMSDLGADQAFLLDGGGSTEMLARMSRGHRLTLRNHPTDGAERPLPLGFGIYRH